MHRWHVSAVAIGLVVTGACAQDKPPVTRQAAVTFQGTASSSAMPCSDPGEWEVRDSAIGPIRVGAAADSVLRLCAGIRDSVVHHRDMEWVDTTRVLYVPVGTRDTVQVTIEPHEQRVDAIAVRTGPFRTADSLGIGAPITQWRRIPGVRVLYGDHSDDGALLVPSHCGLTFGISGGGDAPADRVADMQDIAAWPDTVRITEIIVTPCSRS